jgi:hypothetical protein
MVIRVPLFDAFSVGERVDAHRQASWATAHHRIVVFFLCLLSMENLCPPAAAGGHAALIRHPRGLATPASL